MNQITLLDTLTFLQKYVGLGGAFLGNKGKFHVHVMPDFRPISCNADVNEWLGRDHPEMMSTIKIQ